MTAADLSADLIAARTAPAKLAGSPDVRTTMSIPRAGCWERGKKISDTALFVRPSRCMSPTVPTTVVQGSAADWEANLKRLPKGSSPGQKRRAIVALIIATGEEE